ncbi:hypothetical protein T11_4835 [Trichinella zimbabwensis]|uniref:Uncharacterized protein n=1 Tax=Trichinella zimbabwensis TaxID=268475 RepID=A0A0V1HKN6_9BILA|nr:hypothetical protein T11_4835 [Trichinella zimbabwensis]
MTMFRKSGETFYPLVVHSGSQAFINRELAGCRRLSGHGGGFFVIDGKDGFRFFSTSFSQNRLFSIL